MRVPFFVIKILKLLFIYNFIKKIYKKHIPYLGIIKYDIESILFEIFLNQKKNPVYVDVGANKGSKIDCAINANRNVKVIAIEPFYKYFKFLKKKFYNFDQIKLFNLAIHKKAEKIFFYYNKVKRDSESFSLKKNKNLNLRTIVKTATLDQILNNKKADLIKIDVEGSEYEVICGGKEAIKNKSTFFIEITHKSYSKVISFLIKKNYNIYIYEYSIFKKNLDFLWKKGNVIQNNVFLKNIFTLKSFNKVIKNKKFMINILAIHKTKFYLLKKIKIKNQLFY